ncbi:MAG: hypothetical protein ACPGGK_15815, partial [Pikeienuella sp.]
QKLNADSPNGWGRLGSQVMILTFTRFLELRENLVQYWNFADYAKKAIFSKIALSNLIIKGQDVASLSFKKPFLDNEEGCFTSYGGRTKCDLNRGWKPYGFGFRAARMSHTSQRSWEWSRVADRP